MKCSECQNLILENKQDKTRMHLKTCVECRAFLEAQKTLSSFSPRMEKCPEHITFESLQIQARKTAHPSALLKWAVPAAAAVLLILTYFPHRQTDKPEQAGKFLYISQTISSDINTLDEEIQDMELELLSADDLLEHEIESLMNEINNFNTEV